MKRRKESMRIGLRRNFLSMELTVKLRCVLKSKKHVEFETNIRDEQL